MKKYSLFIILLIFLINSCGIINPDVKGCIDSRALNYNPDATTSDNTCEYLPFHDYTDFRIINGMDVFGNPTEFIGSGISGGCIENNQFIDTESLGSSVSGIDYSCFEITDSNVSYICSGSIVGVQMTLTHGDDFMIQLTDNAMVALYTMEGDTTRLIIIAPETNELFTYTGDFGFVDVIVANSQEEISIALPGNGNSTLSTAYPNPFIETTSFTLSIGESALVKFYIVDENYQMIRTIINDTLEAAAYYITWDSRDDDSTLVSPGYYRAIADFGEKQCFTNLQLVE